MTKKITSIAIIGLVILQLITISKVSNLEMKIQNVQSQLNSERNDLRNEMSSISSRIKNELEQQSSILDSFEYEIGMLDEETLSAPVTFRVVPKQKSQGMIAELYYGDRTVEMQAQGAGFTTTFDIGLFEEEDCRINLSAAGTDNLESLDFEPREIRRKYLPTFYAFYHDFGQGIYEDGVYQTEGFVDINIKPDGLHGITIESVELIATLDGNVISRIEPSLEKESTEQAISSEEQSFLPAFHIDQSFKMDPSQRLRFILVGQDSLGLVHSIVLQDVRIDSSNNNDVIYEEAITDNWEIITDAQGNVLSGPEDYVLVQ